MSLIPKKLIEKRTVDHQFSVAVTVVINKALLSEFGLEEAHSAPCMPTISARSPD
jgi:hypothetical protein